MASKVTPRVRMPATAKAGEIIEVKTLVSHEMESGQRKDASGKIVPRHIINKFTATFNGQEILSADWHPAISANPYQSFSVRATETGVFVFSWFDDDGSVYKSEHKVTVS
jgi:sulfur-oxidizing protein SoxZ